MARHDPGPRGSESVEPYLRETRVIAAVAVLALVGGVVSDGLAGQFWNRHALLASLVASVIVVMLSVALLNEALERQPPALECHGSGWVSDSDEMLGRWASVMLNADAYAEVLNRHVELTSDVAWLGTCSTTPSRPTPTSGGGAGAAAAPRSK
jgi:hypothetical protein